MSDAPPSPVRVTIADGVAAVTIDRPKSLNALDAPTLEALDAAVAQVRGDASVRVVTVTGAGEKAFSAGADIAAMAAMAPTAGVGYARLGHRVLAALEALPTPVIAAVGGVALGGGLELALACDLIVASERARLGLPEIGLGLIPGFGGTQRLAVRIGLARARDLIYQGRVIDAAEAQDIGLVSRVVPAGELATAVDELARTLAGKAPVALRAAKRATAAAMPLLAAGLAHEVEAFGLVFATEDRVEGLHAFLDKRPAQWRGR